MDPELEAILKCTELLKGLEDEAKIRVLQYLINRYKLTPTHNPFQSPVVNATQFYDSKQIQKTSSNEVHGIISEASNYPTIKDLIAKDLPKSEVEWILIYALYASDFGTNDFTREDLINQYELSKRKTTQVMKNFNANLNAIIKKDWIKSINDKELIILQAGKDYANEIISGKSQTKARKPSKRKSKEKIIK